MFIFHLYNAQARVKQMIEVVRDAEFVVCKTLEENNHACSTVGHKKGIYMHNFFFVPADCIYISMKLTKLVKLTTEYCLLIKQPCCISELSDS